LEVDIHVNPFPLAAYKLIYDEWYRDQNLQEKTLPVLLTPGNTNAAKLSDVLSGDAPYLRAWEHDYFTSCLPFAQKGDSVQIPLVDQGTVKVTTDTTNNKPAVIRKVSDDSRSTGTLSADIGDLTASSGTTPSYLDPNGSLEVDLMADAADINTLRRAFRLQEWLERNARGGTRYIENILSHFGVRSSDARLQRPEYLGGDRQKMVISEVLSTAQSDNDPATATVAVGQLAGHGISVGGGKQIRYRAEEHGWIIGIINVRPASAYFEGIHRQFTRLDRLDYAWPVFAEIGEQAVLNKEIFMKSSEANGTFGYIPRYSEYKFANNRVAGEFRSSLDYWHLGRKFDTGSPTGPELNSDFVKCLPSSRIFAVTDPTADNIYSHVFNRITAVRKLPRFGIPQI